MSEPTPAQLIRLYSDGELAPDAVATLNDLLTREPRYRQAVRFEEELRARVGAAMKAEFPAAPGSLADRVRAAVMAARQAETEPAARPTVARRPTDRTTLAGWWAGPRRANIFAVAATLLIVASAVLIGVFGPRLDDLRASARAPQPSQDAVTAAALFAVDEHGRCAGGGASLRHQTPRDVESALTSLFGTPVTVFDLGPKGYSFVGGERCPEDVCGQPTGHIMYARQSDSHGPAMVSIFILPECTTFSRGPCGQRECGEWRVAQGCRKKVLLRAAGPLRYLLVCCDDGDLRGLATYLEGLLVSRRPTGESGSPEPRSG
jgi:hypothetical protein